MSKTTNTTNTTQQPHQTPEYYNSRQYTCKCTKTYKSYPALYTHIKNKHPNDIEQYKVWSKKPRNRSIEKGRPKKNKSRPKQAQIQGELLNIIELGVLNIDDCIRNQKKQNNEENQNSVHNLLIGNSTQKFQQIERVYQEQKRDLINKLSNIQIQESLCQTICEELMKRNITQLLSQKSIKVFKEEIKFKNQLIQHFSKDLSVKIILELQLIQIQQFLMNNRIVRKKQIRLIDQFEEEGNNQYLSAIAQCESHLWNDNQQLIRVVRSTNQKWQDAVQSMLNSAFQNSQNVQSIACISQNSIEQASYQYQQQQ